MSEKPGTRRKPIIWIVVAVLLVLLAIVVIRSWVGTADNQSVGVNEGRPGRDGGSL